MNVCLKNIILVYFADHLGTLKTINSILTVIMVT